MTNTETTAKAGWNFDHSYARLPGIFYTKQRPDPVRSPKLITFNESLAQSLGLMAEPLLNDGAAIFSGNELPEGADPLAQAYAGHQFGHFTMLGDGRAILLGEHITPDGARMDIQLKGSGRTPYSRGGDGRAVLGPMLREYIISEAMAALGIPTSRSLAVVTTGEPVYRETVETGAILTRVAKSHLRVGTFQYAANWGEKSDLEALADYALERHYPGYESAENRYLYLLQQVIQRQAALIAKWQHVGFIHGVMNTDNMTISGETIDYGPCAFMDTFDLATVFSSIDRQGRYAYGNQPPIGAWNLARLAESLLPILHSNEDESLKLAEEAIAAYPDIFRKHWLGGFRAKLGLFNEEAEDEAIVQELLKLMAEHKADFTNTFRALTLDQPVESALGSDELFCKWQSKWQDRRTRQQETLEQSRELMRKTNPALIPRNHRVEEALEAAEQEDLTVMHKLLDVFKDPFAYSDEQTEYADLPPDSDAPYQTFCGT